jgi:restriction system protein
MAIPDFQTLMLPLLSHISDGREYFFRDVVESIGDEFNLTDAERNELLPSGRYPTFNNRLTWAKTYLKKAGLLTQARRGYFELTARGRDVLAEKPTRIDMNYLMRFPEYLEFKNASRVGEEASELVRDLQPSISITPEETLDSAYQRIGKELALELADKIKTCTPQFFEQLVVQLLLKMGYGGSRQEAGRAVGRSGDGGIDGVINEDRLGLDAIYIQAKRWEGSVGRPEIQKFVGALHGQRASKGVFITTSYFTSDAIEYAGNIQNKVVLINGARLAELMIEFNLGVSVAETYEIKRIDSDFFSEE